MDIYFSDHFKVNPETLKEYGAFNISLVSDLPLFIDPFLLFNSKKEKYQILHETIIKYLTFLKEMAKSEQSTGTLKAWYIFKEVEQNWFGFSVGSNKGSALGMDFATALNQNLYKIFQEFGEEKITKSSHLEKLCLIKDGVGKDNISDFATNLIKEFLLEYTQSFAQKYIDHSFIQTFRVPRTRFNYETEVWEEATFELPKFKGDFIILTPREILTKDDTWINRKDLLEEFDQIPSAIPDEQLRFQVNNYFRNKLAADKKDKQPTKTEKMSAASATIQAFPQIIDYYIKYKEENGDRAVNESDKKVLYSENLYVQNVQNFIAGIQSRDFYLPVINSRAESRKKITILKEYIENNDGYKLFYHKGTRIKGEKDLQLLFGLVCHESTVFDVNREVNNGRGSVDSKLSMGSANKTLVEFKLASNRKLKQNLQKQVEIYEKANKTKSSFKVIMYFTHDEHKRAVEILNILKLTGMENIILIDARSDNKKSASIA